MADQEIETTESLEEDEDARPDVEEPVEQKMEVKLPPPRTEPKEEPKPKDDGRPKVELRVFIASGGIKWDQLAGFKSFATRNRMGPLSIPEWRAALNDFMKRPV